MRRLRSPKTLSLALLALLLAVTALPVTPAAAHAELVRSVPEAGAQLDAAPAAIDLYFNEPIEASFNEIAVYDADGARVEIGATHIDPADPTHLAAELPPLADGAYLITWKVVSIADGHPMGGAFNIGIGAAGGAALAAAQSPAPPAAGALPGQALAKALLYLATAILAGGTLFALLIWRPALAQVPQADDAGPHFERLLRRYALAGLILLAAAGLIGVSVQAGAIAGGTWLAPWDPRARAVLLDSHFGLLTLARMALLFALAGTLLPPANRWNRAVALPALALLLLTLSLGSHAAAQENPLLIAADLAHATAAAAWIGGLGAFLLALLALRGLEPAARLTLAARALPRFSALAMASAALLALTGVLQATVAVGSPQALFGSDYGRALLVKLALVGIVLALGAANHFILRPRILRAAGAQAGDAAVLAGFRRTLAVEAALGAVLLAWVGLFTSLPPANPAASGPHVTRTIAVDDLKLRLVAAPGRVGANTFTLDVTAGRVPADDVREVILVILPSDPAIPPTKVTLAEAGAGRYTTGGALIYPDRWQLKTIIRRSAHSDSYADFYIDARPTVPLARGPLTTGLLGAAGVTLVLAAATLLAGIKKSRPVPAG